MSGEYDNSFQSLLAGLGSEEPAEKKSQRRSDWTPEDSKLSRFLLDPVEPESEPEEPEDPHRVPTVPLNVLCDQNTDVFDEEKEFDQLIEQTRCGAL